MKLKNILIASLIAFVGLPAIAASSCKTEGVKDAKNMLDLMRKVSLSVDNVRYVYIEKRDGVSFQYNTFVLLYDWTYENPVTKAPETIEMIFTSYFDENCKLVEGGEGSNTEPLP